MSNKLLSAWGARAGLNILLSLVLPFVVLGIFIGCMIIAAVIPLPDIRGWDERDVRAFIFVGMLIAGMVAALLGAVAYGGWAIANRARTLDAAFTPLGLTGGMYLINGRQYHGTLLGRQIDAYFHRGPTLELYVSAPLKTRLGIGTKDSVGMAIAGLMNRQPLDTGDPELGGLAVYPMDEQWARTLLADPEAKAAALRLATDKSLFGIRSVNIQPGSIALRMRYINWKMITAEAARQWVNALITISRAAESLPPPTQTAEETPMEYTVRTNRGSFSTRVMLITFAAFGVPFVCVMAITLAIVFLTTR